MSKQKKQWLQFYNRILAGVMALLGFTACEETGREEYGVPHANFEVKGKVLTPDKKAAPDIQIIMKGSWDKNAKNFESTYGDTLITDQNGEFHYEKEETSTGKYSYRVVYRDIKNNVYKTDSVQVDMNATGGKGSWHAGSDSKEVIINLEEKAKDDK